MAKIVLAWELGADLGHISRLDALAQRLQQNGHNVTLALSRSTELQRLYPADTSPPYAVLSAPAWPDKPVKLSRAPANLAEVLLALGYHKYAALLQRVQEWRQIFSSLAPDLIVFDYAPTALLATRDRACAKIALDDPFTRPPDTSPFPAYDKAISTQNLQLSENKIVEVINQVLGAIGLEKIRRTYEIFRTDVSFMLSIAEMDPFAQFRDRCHYLGPIQTALAGARKFAWRSDAPTKKVFAYLKPDYPAIREFLAALADPSREVKVFLPGAQTEFLDLCAKYGFDTATTPFDLVDLNQCDLVICHGGHATALRASLAGVPLLIIPLQQEQLSTARKCIENGLGLGLGAGVTDRGKVTAILQQLLEHAEFRANARSCADKYRHQLAMPAAEIIADHLEKLL